MGCPTPARAFSPDAPDGRPWSQMQGRFLNHLELVYRPGDKDVAMRLFELLGFEVKDIGLHWILLGVDGPGQQDFSNNAFYASEVLPEQHALAEALGQATASPEIAPLLEAYESRRRRQPQMFPHFGIRLSAQAQADAIARIESLDDPQLKDRIAVRIFEPDDPETVAPGMRQAFIYTDIVFHAPMPTSMVLELQVVVEQEALLA